MNYLSWDPAALTGSVVPFAPSYASFYSTATQPLTQNAETLITHNGTFVSTPDIYLSTPSVIKINTAGVYKFLYSVQADKTAGGGTSAVVDIYVKNLLAFPNSSSRSVVNNAVEIVLTCEYIFSFTAGETIEVAAFTTGANVRFPYFPAAGVVPGTPSIITNIIRIA